MEKTIDQQITPTIEEIAQAADVLGKLTPGFLPKEIFEQYTRLCTTPIIEVVPLRKNGEGNTEVLLFSRPDDDPNWPGMLHTPGTVLRSTDVNEGIDSALARINNDELGMQPQTTPEFVDVVFHQVNRGAELASVYYLDLTGQEAPAGIWVDSRDLPENIVSTQVDFIKKSVDAFKAQGALQ